MNEDRAMKEISCPTTLRVDVPQVVDLPQLPDLRAATSSRARSGRPPQTFKAFADGRSVIAAVRAAMAEHGKAKGATAGARLKHKERS